MNTEHDIKIDDVVHLIAERPVYRVHKQECILCGKDVSAGVENYEILRDDPRLRTYEKWCVPSEHPLLIVVGVMCS